LVVTCGRETLGAILRPGNAGANTASDHIDALELALEALPASVLDGEILARADGAGASHDFADACRETKVRFSLGYTIRETVREAILSLNERAWTAALNQDGEQREGAWVAELTSNVDLSAWPAGTRLICRRDHTHFIGQTRATRRHVRPRGLSEQLQAIAEQHVILGHQLSSLTWR
jgi:hypothetical protein